MSYIPPHLRNRKSGSSSKETETVKVVDSDFPKFMSERKPVSSFKGPSFAEKLASQPKMELPIYRETEYVAARRTHIPIFTKEEPEFGSEEEEEDEQKQMLAQAPVPENDGWQTVERKIRVKRDKVQEAMDNDDAPIEDEETAWDDNQPEEHETYWDDRRH